MSSYDLIVIGSGPGGYVAAIQAAKLNKKVALIEKEELGGTCLNRGCVPTKTLLHSAFLYHEIKNGAELGIVTSDIHLDFDKLNKRKDSVITGLRNGIDGLLKANGVSFLQGTATIFSSKEVYVNDTRLTTEHILIATGSNVSIPPIPGIDSNAVVTSDELLQNPRPYKSLTIIGGGVIGVEFATFYNALGCEVTIIEAIDRILPFMDREISQNLSFLLKRRGIRIITGATIERIQESTCHMKSSSMESPSVSAEGILIAVGRCANTNQLFADSIKPETIHGHISVNESFETTIPGIYAIGDVIAGGTSLAHAASAQGIQAVCVMFGEAKPYYLATIPSCIYTNPEIACVGLTAENAKRNGIDVIEGKTLVSANCKSVIEQSERGFIKLVFHKDTKVLLGAQLMCNRATDLIGELCTAIANRLDISQLSAAVKPHPSYTEAVHEAVQDAIGVAIHAMPRRR